MPDTCTHTEALAAAVAACERHEAGGCYYCRRALADLKGVTQAREAAKLGGAAGKGAAKRRGGRTRAEVSAHMRELVRKRWAKRKGGR